jgi:pyruvate,water dikinase
MAGMSASPGSGSGADLAVIPDEECWVDIAGGRYVGMKPSTRFPIYTRGNAGEVFPEVAYPLTFTTSALWATRAAARSALKTGAVTEAELAEPSALLAFLGGYAYLNLSANRVLAGRAPGGKPSDADLQVLGVSTVPYVRQKGDRSVLASLRLARWALGVIRNPSMQVQVRDEREFRAWRATLPAPSALSDAEIIELLRSMIGRSADLFEHHLEATGMAGVPIALLAKFCDKKLHDPSMLSKLIAGVGNIDSAAPAFALWKLGRTVRGSAALTEQFDRGVDGLHDRLRADDRADAAAFLSGFGGFLDEFGSRGPNEWESACPTWGTDPDMVLSMLDRLRLTSDDNDPAPAAERLVKERGIAYEHVTTRIGRRQRKQLDGL